MTLLERRAEVFARAKILESVSGSNWHEDDPQEVERRKKGGVPLSAKLIGLHDDDRVFLVGPDVETARRGLNAYIEQTMEAKRKAANDNVDLEWTPVERHALLVARRTVEAAGDVLSFPTQDWNGMLFALAKFGIQCVTADAKTTPKEER